MQRNKGKLQPFLLVGYRWGRRRAMMMTTPNLDIVELGLCNAGQTKGVDAYLGSSSSLPDRACFDSSHV
jgi:hypothetical protein